MKGMKKFLGIFITLLLLAITNNVKAEILFTKEKGMKCDEIVEHPGGNASKTCTIGFTVEENAEKINQLQMHLTLTNVTLAKKDIKLNDGWFIDTEDLTGKYYTFGTTKASFDIGYHEIATITFYKVVNEQECKIEYELNNITTIDRSCTIYQGTYYDKNGNITTKQTYEDQCLAKPKACTKDGNKYYGKDGTEVSKKQYQMDCETNVCKDFGDGTYFGIEGKKVDKQTYEKECTDSDKHYCEKIDDDYYGQNGTIVNEKTYKAECEENPKCKKVDDKYYDAKGNETTEVEYEKQCKKHSCEIIEDTYFDKDGKVVDKATYDKYCPTPENPSTGNFLPFIPLFILFIGGIAIYIYTKKEDKLI